MPLEIYQHFIMILLVNCILFMLFKKTDNKVAFSTLTILIACQSFF